MPSSLLTDPQFPIGYRVRPRILQAVVQIRDAPFGFFSANYQDSMPTPQCRLNGTLRQPRWRIFHAPMRLGRQSFSVHWVDTLQWGQRPGSIPVHYRAYQTSPNGSANEKPWRGGIPCGN